MRDKFIALDKDKCELIYHILHAITARTVVEAGTSFGVSTIYPALAVAQNAASNTKTDYTLKNSDNSRISSLGTNVDYHSRQNNSGTI
jgi:predicted O-methyltransferase YrrM